ncbi:MAG TPA: multiheme c-type cytochrome [Isosphaeraceae bacterium]|nr:multiheme c-type cytochrome [Isosphaeraceae bacterium]
MAGNETSNSVPRSQPAAPSLRRPLAVSAVSVLALLMVAGWLIATANRTNTGSHRAVLDRLLTIDRPFPPEGRFPGDPYIGSRACAECHPGEAALHARSGHAVTLRPASRLALARHLDGTTLADPERPEVQWSYQYRDDRLQLARTAPDGVQRWVVDYAFGSGHHATTFVTLVDPAAPRLFEHRLTYYRREHRLDLTPGQHEDEPRPGVTPSGYLNDPRNSRKCFGCHSTQVSARGGRGIDEETMIPNVSCERCHGPGRAHVAAARGGASGDRLTLPFGPDRWTAESQMRLCGTCHRHPSRARPDQLRPDDPQLARFQPVGIIQSRCYRQSGGGFSCLSCHDPHARAAGDRATYDAVCLSCHAGPGSRPQRAVERSQPAAARCPIRPGGDCVECHMPRVDSGQHILFTDHWIRIRRPGQSRTMRRGPGPELDLLVPTEP